MKNDMFRPRAKVRWHGALGAIALAMIPALGGVPATLRAQEAAEDTTKDEREPGPWKVDVTASLNLSQSAFSDNWSGGDKGSATWALGSNLSGQRQFTRQFHWSNVLQLAYGQTLRQVEDPADPAERRWDEPEKTTDLIQLESVGRFTLDRFVDPYLAFRLESQFADESSPLGRILFNPLRLKETAGVARVLHKSEEAEAITRVGFGFRQNVGRTFVDAAGEEKELFTTNDGGFEWQTDVTRPLLAKRILYKATLLAYLPVFYNEADELEDVDRILRQADPSREEVADFWKSPDVNFQNTFTAQITKLLSVNLYVQWIYNKFDEATNVDSALAPDVLLREIEKGIRKGGQFKQTLAIGLSYTFF